MPLSFCFLFRPSSSSSSSSCSSGYSNVLFLLWGFFQLLLPVYFSLFFLSEGGRRAIRLLLIIAHEGLKAQHRHGSSRICRRRTRWCSPVIQVETVDVVRQILDLLLSHSICSTIPSRALTLGVVFAYFSSSRTLAVARGAQDR